MAHGASCLVGRDAELGRLADAVSDAREGVRTAVVLEGDAGLGKSRLASETLHRFGEPKDAVGLGYGVELTGPEIPYRVATDLLRTLARDVGVDPVREAAGAYAPALVPLLPSLAGAGDLAGDPEATPARVLPAFVATVEQLATERPVWLLVEDLPWVDAFSRDLLAYLLRAVQDAQLLILVTMRTHDPATDPAVDEVVADPPGRRGRRSAAQAPWWASTLSATCMACWCSAPRSLGTSQPHAHLPAPGFHRWS